MVLHSIGLFFRREMVLTISLFCAVASMFLVPPGPGYAEYVDFKVLACLFMLMLVVAGLRSVHVFDALAYRLLSQVKVPWHVSAILVALVFVSSMTVTNDVALITFVPFTVVVFGMGNLRRPVMPTIVLQTVAANVGSSLTPMGNPQNLYLYTHYHMRTLMFFSTMIPMVLAGALLLLVLVWAGRRAGECFEAKLHPPAPVERRWAIRYIVLFIIALLAVFDILPYMVALVLVALGSSRKLFLRMDYPLLLTFVAFFVFAGNLGALDAFRTMMETLLSGRVFFVSLGVSQIISNVPAAVLLSHFTGDAQQLLLGVNAGGCGTLVASLASVISFKFHAAFDNSGSRRYLVFFTIINVLFLAVFSLVWLVMFRV